MTLWFVIIFCFHAISSGIRGSFGRATSMKRCFRRIRLWNVMHYRVLALILRFPQVIFWGSWRCRHFAEMKPVFLITQKTPC
jgi:hypothetical protein